MYTYPINNLFAGVCPCEFLSGVHTSVPFRFARYRAFHQCPPKWLGVNGDMRDAFWTGRGIGEMLALRAVKAVVRV